MDRLTKKITDDMREDYLDAKQEYTFCLKHTTEYMNKFGKIEDIEEELGCPLEVVFKAIKYGIDGYLKLILEYDENDGWYFDAIWKYNDFGDYSTILYLEDYQITWWLKGDRSE